MEEIGIYQDRVIFSSEQLILFRSEFVDEDGLTRVFYYIKDSLGMYLFSKEEGETLYREAQNAFEKFKEEGIEIVLDTYASHHKKEYLQ